MGIFTVLWVLAQNPEVPSQLSVDSLVLISLRWRVPWFVFCKWAIPSESGFLSKIGYEIMVH